METRRIDHARFGVLVFMQQINSDEVMRPPGTLVDNNDYDDIHGINLELSAKL